MRASFDFTVVTVAVCSLVSVTLAHEGPGEVIRRLSHEIDAGRGSAGSYHDRAIEWRLLGKPGRAARDLRLALRVDAEFVPAWHELALVSVALGDPGGAVAAAERAVLIAENGDHQTQQMSRLLLAEILQRTGRATPALRAIDRAFAMQASQDVDAYWLRAEILADLGRRSARRACLQEGWRATGAEALRIAWIESCIDTGLGDEVLALVERGIASARLKAAWRIRRARVLIGVERNEEAQLELRLAIFELETRIHPLCPDPTVVGERDTALDLLAKLQPLARAR